jgi:hypothetical protein
MDFINLGVVFITNKTHHREKKSLLNVMKKNYGVVEDTA